jgi:iron(III) transport system ATP-binding protein
VTLAIHVQDLEVALGGRKVLGPISLCARPGEHILVVGPSGCGKTTLLRALAGFARPFSGTIELFGKPASHGRVQHLAPSERRIGMLFQGGALWPHMSVRRTLRFVLRYAGVPRGERRERCARLLALVELEGLERRKAATLSGGEAQRLGLARALAAEPQLLLLDEPLGPLDAALRQGLLERLARVHQELGLTIMHVTHDPGEARHVATRTLHMERGVLVADEQHAPAAAAEEPLQ